MNTLDDDCLSSILTFFSVEELCELQYISRRFSNCAARAKHESTTLTLRESPFWLAKHPERSYREYTDILNEDKLLEHLNRFPNVQRLFIYGFLTSAIQLFNIFANTQLRNNVKELYVLFEHRWSRTEDETTPLLKIFPNITRVTIIILDSWRDFEDVIQQLKINEVKEHTLKHYAKMHHSLAETKEILCKEFEDEPLLNTELFMKSSATKGRLEREIGTHLSGIVNLKQFVVKESFEEEFMDFWQFIRLHLNEKLNIKFTIPNSNPYTSLQRKKYIIDYLLCAASAYLLAERPTKGSFAAYYNKLVLDPRVEYLKQTIKYFIGKGFNKKEEIIMTADQCDTSATSAAMSYSTRKSKINLFSWKDFIESCFEQDVEPPKKKQRLE
jgi:hypothetical protein